MNQDFIRKLPSWNAYRIYHIKTWKTQYQPQDDDGQGYGTQSGGVDQGYGNAGSSDSSTHAKPVGTWIRRNYHHVIHKQTGILLPNYKVKILKTLPAGNHNQSDKGFNQITNFTVNQSDVKPGVSKPEHGIQKPDEAVLKPEYGKPDQEKGDKIPIDDEKEQKIDEKWVDDEENVKIDENGSNESRSWVRKRQWKRWSQRW